MTEIEPAAWRYKRRDQIVFAVSQTEPSPAWDIVEPLYTKQQLQPRVKMNKNEFDEFKQLLSTGISTAHFMKHLI